MGSKNPLHDYTTAQLLDYLGLDYTTRDGGMSGPEFLIFEQTLDIED